MKKALLFILFAGLFLNLSATKKVAYVTFTKTMDGTATTVTNDPIIQMLNADPNLEVTVKATTAAGETISDLANYDVIIVQESFGSGDAILTPTGSLGIATMPKPFIYNKTYGLRKGKALGSSGATAAAAVESNSLSITVESGASTNDLFKACAIGSSNEITVFNALMTDLGASGTKSLNYNTGFTISSSTSTLLAQPTGVTTAIVAINDIPAGSTIDTQVLTSRMIAISMNFGAICGNAGKNITDDGLTIWRNAVYILAGLTVPSTKATLPTGLNNVRNDNSNVISEDYYTINGVLVKEPVKGIYLKKSTFENGTVKFDKVVLTQPLLK
jgi:hypothetical protein